MISCKRAVELLSQQMEENLSEEDNRSLQIHLFICEFCELFRKHIERIRAAMRGLAKREGEERLSDDAKQDLIDRIRAKISQR